MNDNENYFVIGTAGHVDHGKTLLIKALTGINTDRLSEEQKRGISIELGFASLSLPDGRKAGIIDVPGHEKFVRQMLAGVHGIDLVLFVIAADEGIMPQTREHLEILKLLNMEKGIVVLTKIDLVDEEWLAFIEQDIKEELASSFLKDAPLCKVSSVTLEGIEDLKHTIVTTLAQTNKRKMDLPARMPIDRVFTVPGFGTVLTGTVKSGIFEKGQEVLIEPGKLKTKIRNIQVHGEQTAKVTAGQRGAMNIGGVAVSEVPKGSNLVIPGYYDTGKIIDVELTNLASESRSITHRQRVHFHLGTAELLGIIHLLEQEEIKPGAVQYAQIILAEPVLAAPGDRFVIRFFSPVTTIGGGKVLGISSRKHKRFKEDVIREFELKAKGSHKERVLRACTGPMAISEICKATNLSEQEAEAIVKACELEGKLTVLREDGSNLYWDTQSAEEWRSRISMEVKAYQQKFPLKGGIGREELKRKYGAGLSLRRWQVLLDWAAEHKFLKVSGNRVELLPEIALPPQLEVQLECLIEKFKAAGLNPPDVTESARACGIKAEESQDYFDYLVGKKILVRIQNLYFSSEAVEKAKSELQELLINKEEITVSDAREHWQISRKYTVPLLEYFDSIHFTKREDQIRRLFAAQKGKGNN